MERSTRDEMCENCRFFSASDLECRRHAPAVVQYTIPIVNPMDYRYRTAFPTTSPYDWCGDWELLLKKADSDKNATTK